MNTPELIRKYNVPAPRYTSYPTVPYWKTEVWEKSTYLGSLKTSYNESANDGISLYIHLPFCENLCTYCGCTTRITKNHLVEEPYIDTVLKEWQMYSELLDSRPRIREIHLGGGTPTFFNPLNLRRLIEGIAERGTIISDAELSFEAHPANTTEEHLNVLYQCGFRRLSLGVQDFDPAVQEIINRRQTVEQVREVTGKAREVGYTSVNFDLIYGLPLQKLNSVENTMKEVIRLLPDRIAYYSYAHVPWVKPGQRRFTEADLPEDEKKRGLYERGREMLLEAGYHDIGMDHFSLESDTLYEAAANQTLHRNFMGYTHRYTRLLIGLGISSISDSWYGFAQNIKSVEAYMKAISDNEFPLIKGHILNDEDLYIRRHILNLMCKGETDLDRFHPLYRKITSRVMPLARDGLVNIRNTNISVTRQGTAFLRNICMCFDQRLWDAKPESQIFSTSV